MGKFITFRDDDETISVKEKYITAIMTTRENGYFEGFLYTKSSDAIQLNENSFNEIYTQLEMEFSENEYIHTAIKEPYERHLFIKCEYLESVCVSDSYSAVRFKSGCEYSVLYEEAKSIVEYVEAHSAHLLEKEAKYLEKKAAKKMKKAQMETLDGLNYLRNEIMEDMKHDEAELTKINLSIAQKTPAL